MCELWVYFIAYALKTNFLLLPGMLAIKTSRHAFICVKSFYIFVLDNNTLKYELNVYKDVFLFIEQDGVSFWKKIYVKFEHSKKSFKDSLDLI